MLLQIHHESCQRKQPTIKREAAAFERMLAGGLNPSQGIQPSSTPGHSHLPAAWHAGADNCTRQLHGRRCRLWSVCVTVVGKSNTPAIDWACTAPRWPQPCLRGLTHRPVATTTTPSAAPHAACCGCCTRRCCTSPWCGLEISTRGWSSWPVA